MKSAFRIYRGEGELPGVLQSSTVKHVERHEKGQGEFFPVLYKEGKTIWAV
jgi:hypothetical protein